MEQKVSTSFVSSSLQNHYLHSWELNKRLIIILLVLNSLSSPMIRVQSQFISTATTNRNRNTDSASDQFFEFDERRNVIKSRDSDSYKNSTASAPNYLVVAPELIQPDSVFQIVVHAFDFDPYQFPSNIFHIKGSIIKDDTEIGQAFSKIVVGDSEVLKIKIPSQLTNGSYKLIVEGNFLKSKGGTVFLHESPLKYSNKFLSILIQTNRYLYTYGQMIRFRCILLQRNLQAYSDPVTVTILDPNGFIMRRWPSAHPKFGVVESSYELPEFSAIGNWTIQVQALQQVENKTIIIEEYFKSLYEVAVTTPPYISMNEKQFASQISAFYGTEKGVVGNGTAKLYGKRGKYSEWILFGFQNLVIDQSTEIIWELGPILHSFDYLDSIIIKVEANITDYMVGEPRIGYAESKIVKESLKLYFLTSAPLIFKPGLPFHTYVHVSTNDYQKVPKDILQNSRIKVNIVGISEAFNINNRFTVVDFPVPADNNNLAAEPGEESFTTLELLDQQLSFQEFLSNGILPIKFNVPKTSTKLILKAEFSDQEGNNILTDEVTAYAFSSPSKKYINVISSSAEVTFGEYAIFQFSSSFFLEEFFYVVLSKGLLLQYGTVGVKGSWMKSTSFALPVSRDMLPGFHVLVYLMLRDGHTLSDSIFVPVNNLATRSKNSMPQFTINDKKDKTKDTIESIVVGDVGSFYGLCSQRSIQYYMQSGNELSSKRVLEKLYEMEPSKRRLISVLNRIPSGESYDKLEFLPTPNTAIDPYKTFTNLNILSLSDGIDGKSFSHKEECLQEVECTGYELCFSYIDECGKIRDCQNRKRIYECDTTIEELIEFRVSRVNKFIDFYDPFDGDWGWITGNVGPFGDSTEVVQVPKVTDTWFLSGFLISPENGFYLFEEVIEYDSTRPFLMTLDSVTSVRRGEQLGVQAILQNKSPKDIFATVILHNSDDYSFVQLGRSKTGNVDEDTINLVNNEFQHLVWLPANSQLEVRLPIRPLIDQGTFEVKITATTQIRSDTASLEIEVLPEGASVGKHTSFILDLKNRATVLKFLDVSVEESPIQPNDPTRTYIYGSPAGHITIYGDIVGPIFPSSSPTTMDELIGKPGKGTADRIFDLAVNTWSLHYLRLTNQLQSTLTRKVFEQMNKSLAHIMKRFNTTGYFKVWDTSEPSVWLTSWALQIFSQATFQDWENHFLVEPKIFSTSVAWLLKYQNLDGTFSETEGYFKVPLNKKMGDKIYSHGPYNVTLTAFVAITLLNAIPILNGQIRFEANLAKFKAVQYLEKHLAELNDPYQIALVTYALTMADSPEKDTCFGKLHGLRREEGGFIYWSPEPIPLNDYIYENQRPFLLAKNNEYWDSYAVETTIYALLSYLIRESNSPFTEQIVSWLNTMKLSDGSFISTIDTALGFQALTEYSYRARLRDITELSISVQLSASADESDTNVKIDSTNIAQVHTIEIPNVWGHVNIIGRGSGQAVINLDVSYGVEWDEFKDTPPKDSFELEITEVYSEERNKTWLRINSCFRWTLVEESEVSGSAVLEIEIPSGYGIVMSDAIDVVSSGVHPTLRDTLISPGKTSWYFDYIPAHWTCFNHTVRRWFPVANLTTTRQASLYEAYSPERFVNVIMRDISVTQLTLCQVCGSFQCPYCPYFSGSQKPHLAISEMITTFITVFVLYFMYSNHQ